ncbi:MAG: vacuolar family H+-ATPase subunit H [Lachnospiraceae bacterium]|jgi:vacuolar-type H+-ATPase subunit H
MSRIEELIGEIEEYIDGCKLQPFSSTKIIVDKAQLEELLVELRHRTPDEIKKYQRILSNKDAILKDARAQAEAIITAANIQTNEMANQSEIVQRAYAKANEIISDATARAQEIMNKAVDDANELHSGAIAYTDQMLENTQNIIGNGMNGLKEKYSQMMDLLQQSYDVLESNRKELTPPAEIQKTPVEVPESRLTDDAGAPAQETAAQPADAAEPQEK